MEKIKRPPNGGLFILAAPLGIPSANACGAFVCTQTSLRSFSLTHCEPPVQTRGLNKIKKTGIKPDFLILAAPLGFEPGFSP